MTQACKQGYDAFKKGLGPDANPYASDPEKKEWESGWEDAKIEAELARRAVCSDK